MPLDEPLSAPEGWHDPPPVDEPHVARALKALQHMPITKGQGVQDEQTLGDTWLPWQDKLTRHLFGTRKDGKRRYETVYVEMPKKSGKSHYAAALALYMLIGQQEYGAEVYSAGYNQKQAKVTWGIALDMIGLSPRLQKWTEDKAYRNEILCPNLSGVYEPLTKQDLGQHGFNPYVVLFDELHTQQDRAMWDAIDDSMGARQNPLLFAITNAGSDRQSLCYEVREYALQVNRGDVEDPTFLGLVYGCDPEEDDYWSPETWQKANPGLGVTVREDWMAQKAEQAKEMPSKQNAFLRWQLGVWTRQETRWLNPDDWDRCEESFRDPQLAGARCYGGLDLGAVDDLTAWLKAFPDPTDPELIRFTCDVWCPEDRLYDRSNPYRQQYQAWAREGWLHTVPDEVMDYGVVRQKIVADSRTYNLVDLAIDTAFQGNQLLVDLVNEDGMEAAGMKTTYNHMTSPCDELERRIRMDPPKIRHNGNPVLAWAMGNVALKQPDPDRKRPVPDKPDAKIDPVVALLMALDRAMRHEDQLEPEPDIFVV